MTPSRSWPKSRDGMLPLAPQLPLTMPTTLPPPDTKKPADVACNGQYTLLPAETSRQACFRPERLPRVYLCGYLGSTCAPPRLRGPQPGRRARAQCSPCPSLRVLMRHRIPDLRQEPFSRASRTDTPLICGNPAPGTENEPDANGPTTCIQRAFNGELAGRSACDVALRLRNAAALACPLEGPSCRTTGRSRSARRRVWLCASSRWRQARFARVLANYGGSR